MPSQEENKAAVVAAQKALDQARQTSDQTKIAAAEKALAAAQAANPK